MSEGNAMQRCAKPGAPAGCAALIDSAAGMMLGGDAATGRKILEDLLTTAQRTGCGGRPQCQAVVQRVADLLKQAG